MGYNHDKTAENQTLKDKLMAIILLETAKDYKKMDSDLVTECVDFLVELEGKERLTKEEVEQRVNEIPFKGKVMAIGSYAKKKLKAKRIAVIAAVLAVLLAFFAIAAVSFTNAEDSLIDRFAHFINEEMKCILTTYLHSIIIAPIVIIGVVLAIFVLLSKGNFSHKIESIEKLCFIITFIAIICSFILLYKPM